MTCPTCAAADADAAAYAARAATRNDLIADFPPIHNKSET